MGKVKARPGRGAVVVAARIAEQAELLVECDRDVRDRRPDSVHRMRVALRRVRSCLETFAPLLDREATRSLLRELGELGDVLGGLRDAEVRREGVARLFTQVPARHLLGPAEDALGEQLLAAELLWRARLDEKLGTRRYASLLEQLSAFAGAPPYSAAGREARLRDLQHLVLDEVSRARRAGEHVTALSGVMERERALHKLRKAAKRARYAAEVLEAVGGRSGVPDAASFERLQEALGIRHDAIVLLETLRELAAQAGSQQPASGHEAGCGYTYGVLAGLLLARIENGEAGLERACCAALDLGLDLGLDHGLGRR